MCIRDRANVISEQTMVATPAFERHAQIGCADRCARQHAVAAPRQATAEPAQGLVVKLLHCSLRDTFHLHGCDACGWVYQYFWRNLCHCQGLIRIFPLVCIGPVSYTHLRAHETRHDLVCRLLLEKKKNTKNKNVIK